jgi:D-alanyl-D-alanine carboxypeptidase
MQRHCTPPPARLRGTTRALPVSGRSARGLLHRLRALCGWVAALAGLAALPLPAGAAQLPSLAAAARTILGSDQGVYVEASDGTVLLAQAASRAVHPASVSKIPTTLALLRKFGPDYRFDTRFSARGRLLDGTLEGNLVVSGDGDPALVDEDAALVAARLNQLGIRRIAGSLRALGSWTFDWQSDPDGTRLQRALEGRISPAAFRVVQGLAPLAHSGLTRAAPPQLRFLRDASALMPTALQGRDDRAELVFRSEPLLAMLKSLNDYSNNIMASLADDAGGAAAVQALARTLVPVGMRSQIILGDGAGENPRNRLSPRAAVRLLRALQRQLATSGHTLCDVLPVSGIDPGTLQDRLNGPLQIGRVVGKTGTYGSYGASALVGALSTRERGTVYFAILDHDVPTAEARRRQDHFVRVLLAQLHARPWNYQRDTRPAVARSQLAAR